jgi:hypothetical protein
MSQNLTLPEGLLDRLQRAADHRGLSVEQLLAQIAGSLESAGQAQGDQEGEEDLLVASTRALLEGSEPAIPVDWREIDDALSKTEPAHATVEETMSALRRRPWSKDA